MMQEVMTQGGKIDPLTAAEEQRIHSQAKSRLSEIEAELHQLRMQREKMSEEWNKEQQRLMGTAPEMQQQKHEFVALPSKKQHGPSKPGAKKSSGSGNNMESSRQKKG
jgi:hypothetical protein